MAEPSTTMPTGLADRPPRARAETRRRRLVVAGLLVVLAVVGIVIYWFSTRDLLSTDDAFIDGDVVQIVPRVAGPVIRLAVTDNQHVAAGDLLLEIDPRDYAVAVENAGAALAAAEAQVGVARANLALTSATTAATLAQAESAVVHARAAIAQSEAQAAAAQAELVRARLDAARYLQLVKSEFAASRQRYEQADAQSHTADAQWRAAQQAIKVTEAQLSEALGKLEEARTGPQQVAVRAAELRASEAQLAAARAALDQAELNLSYTRIHAPQDGVVTKRAVRQGDVVQKDQTLGTLVFGAPWVTANFKETQLTRMRPGQPVELSIDAYPGTVFKAHVDSVQRGTGARFSLLPPENATGNFVKVVQRVPVKILFDQPPPAQFVLSLGMSVIPTVDVSGGAAAR
jgi:membrane fusion protein (multidrug efflux system)